MSTVHLVVPDGIDDPDRPSGGNSYDRRARDELVALGWSVHEHPVVGGWPEPDEVARSALAHELAALSDGALVLIDGLVASSAPDVLLPERGRLLLVVLMHMPLFDVREQDALAAARAIIATSEWTSRQLTKRYERAVVHVAEPGIDLVPLDATTPDPTALLCVAAVTPGKGHDVLLEALAGIADLPWRCTCVGPLDRDPAFVSRLRRQADADGITDRVRFTGPRAGADLDRAYATAGAFVLASRAETYGMVVAEALARALPVIATEVGGLPETLGQAPDGRRPGLLVAPDDPDALGQALRRWLTDEGLRAQLRAAAGERRKTLHGWPATAERIAEVLRTTATC